MPESFANVSLKAKNFKCFGDVSFGFDEIKPINIAIGRNNSGKSTLLDAVQFATVLGDIQPGSRGGEPAEILLEVLVDDEVLNRIATDTIVIPMGGGTSENHPIRRLATQLLAGKRISVRIGSNETLEFDRYIGVDANDPYSKLRLKALEGHVLRVIANPFRHRAFRRILADRDIVPETESDHGPGTIQPNGIGTTNAIRAHLNLQSLSSDLIEIQFLDALNRILRPDTDFSRILVQQPVERGNWEINLVEPKKGRYSQCPERAAVSRP